jgi:NAD(P)-dependent dehydrogenase (short-subunit alcohol dehydrogenase family)
MDFFKGKTAIVTGAGSGIGRALALALADAGCRLAVTDIRPERVDAVVEELTRKGVEAAGYLVDHSRLEDVQEFAKKFFERWGRVDILCQNAGVGIGARFLETSLEEWKWVIDINLWGTIYMLVEFVPRMVEQGGGSILLTSSDAGLVALPFSTAYNATKFGVTAIGETMRQELAEHDVRVSLLCPGDINTRVLKDGKLHIYDRTGRSARPELEKYYEEKGADPSVVAEAALKGLQRDKAIILVPWVHHGPLYLLHRISPQAYHAVMGFALQHGIAHKMMNIRR